MWPLAPPYADVWVETDDDEKPHRVRTLLEDEQKRELEVWATEWKRPQAQEWERNGQELEVAIFVRTLIDAELPSARAATRTLVRQQMEALGISLPGLQRNRWRIAEMPKTEDTAKTPRRAGLKVVKGGDAA